MLVSLNWLQTYVDINDITPANLADLITKAGIEVETMYKLSVATNCVIGHVLEKMKHPEADKLNVCKVDLGNEVAQIVCGAANVAVGQKVIVSKVGATLPGGVKIKAAKLRGVESNGMICSLKELGIENKFVPLEYQSGIYVLDESAPVGEDALKYLGIDDTILELKLTPNRADALSMLGVAYEVAAILKRVVNKPYGENVNYKIDHDFNVTINTVGCTLYYAKKIKNVKVEPSPQWLQTALIASGIRPISNVVDVTNFVMLELGQPLHAFDYKKLNSNQIVVRNAYEFEKIVTLDHNERELLTSDVVITDGKKPIAIAGVMGGQNTEIDNNTTDVLLESAVFNPLSVRRTYTRLGLRSESSLRYEKKVDPNRTLYALNRASQLLEAIAMGKVDDLVAFKNNQANLESLSVSITLNKINSVLGIHLNENEVSSIFTRLNFDHRLNKGVFTVNVPTRRQDISIEEDLIEEVIRIYGYDNLNKTLPLTESIGKLTDNQAKIRQIKRVLNASGLNEVVTYSLNSEKNVNRFKYNNEVHYDEINLSMPMSEERKVLRVSLLHSLMEVINYNNARNNNDIAIFEMGRQYYFENNEPKENSLLTCAVTGLIHETKWQGKKESVDFYYLKGILEAVLTKLNLLDQYKLVQTSDCGSDFHPKRTANILINDTIVGIIGQVHPNTQKEYDTFETYVLEVNLSKVLNIKTIDLKFKLLNKYPTMTRDIAVVVDKVVSAEELCEAIKQRSKNILKSVEVFDVYQGEHVEANKKSIALSLVFENTEKTLTDDEVNKVFDKIVYHLTEKFNAYLRK
jgi:phenylalanyl-tRNA synthetase beta chain